MFIIYVLISFIYYFMMRLWYYGDLLDIFELVDFKCWMEYIGIIWRYYVSIIMIEINLLNRICIIYVCNNIGVDCVKLSV